MFAIKHLIMIPYDLNVKWYNYKKCEDLPDVLTLCILCTVLTQTPRQWCVCGGVFGREKERERETISGWCWLMKEKIRQQECETMMPRKTRFTPLYCRKENINVWFKWTGEHVLNLSFHPVGTVSVFLLLVEWIWVDNKPPTIGHWVTSFTHEPFFGCCLGWRVWICTTFVCGPAVHSFF